MHLRTLPALLTTVSALALASCGEEQAAPPAAGSTASTPAAAPEVAAPAAEAATAEPAAELPAGPKLPDVEVIDLDGGKVNVTDVAGAKPTLVWFYAPHCPACRAEAAGVEAFAKRHRDALTVVGLGTQDSLDEAREFRAEHGLATPRMLWDEGFSSWQKLGVQGQPAAMLFDRDGVSRGRWIGAFDEQQVLAMAARLA